MSRYAARSDVPLARTKQEIEKLLETWGCSKVGIFADHEANTVELQFLWRSQDDGMFAARFAVELEPDGSMTKRQAEQDQRGKLRALLYFLRSAFAAVDVGIITPEEVFLPWLQTGTGQTVAETLLPKLRELSTGNAAKLLAAGR